MAKATSVDPSVGQAFPQPFVGRKPTLAALQQALATTLTGHGQVRFVLGEAGSGKTALLAEFARRRRRPMGIWWL